MNKPYAPSDAAYDASEYYNSLSLDERSKLAPLLEHYRQLGLAEAREYFVETVRRTEKRITGIRDADKETSGAL